MTNWPIKKEIAVCKSDCIIYDKIDYRTTVLAEIDPKDNSLVYLLPGGRFKPGVYIGGNVPVIPPNFMKPKVNPNEITLPEEE